MHDPEIRRGKRQMLCVGITSPEERAYFSREAGMPVEYVADLDDCESLSDALVFVRHTAIAAKKIDNAQAARRNVRILLEHDLASKFRA
jgi:hypothetical protein